MFFRMMSIGLLVCFAATAMAHEPDAASESATSAGLIVVPTENGPNPWTDLDFDNSPEQFQFLIVADRTGGMRRGIFPEALRKANLMQPEFVMSVGDLIQGYTEDEAVIEAEWDEFMDILEPLEAPFFFVPGNHDMTNPVMAEHWERRFGRSYYHFVYRDVLFICLNTEDGEQTRIGEEQAAYVRKVLEDNPDPRWTLVFMHKPLWVYEDFDPERDTGWKAIEPMLADRPHTVFAGHFHTYTKHTRNDHRYFVLATTGGGSRLRGPDHGQFDHVVWVTMTDDGPVIANLLLDGIVEEDIYTPRTDQLIRGIGQLNTKALMTTDEMFNGGTWELRLTNDADVPAEVSLAFDPHATLRPESESIELTLPPNTVETIEVPIGVERPVAIERMKPLSFGHTWRVTPDDHRPLEVTGTGWLRPIREYTAATRAEPVTIDGVLDEWGSLPFVVEQPVQLIDKAGSWNGADDASFRFAVAADDEYVYVAVAVTDERVETDPESYPWNQDAVEIRIDARAEALRSANLGRHENKDHLTLIISSAAEPGSPPVAVFQRDRLPEGLRYASMQTDTGHVTELAIPRVWLDEQAGGSAEGFRLNIAIDDVDEPEGPRAQLWWNPDWRTNETYAG